MTPMFDFGIVHARRLPPFGPAGAMWSWSLPFRGDPEIWHIVRRTGNLKRWT